MPLPAGRGGAPWTGGAVRLLIAAAPVLYFFGAHDGPGAPGDEPRWLM